MNDILLIVTVSLLVLMLLMQLILMGRMGRVERRIMALNEEQKTTKELERVAAKNESRGGLYEKFIAEDRSRLSLSKREQAAAFRDWRKQHGMTWHGADDES